MRPFTIIVIIAAMSVTVVAKGTTVTYAAPAEKVFAAVLEIVAEQWTLEHTDKATGLVSFRAGTQDGSVLVTGLGENSTQVTVNAKAARAGISWGAGIDGKKIRGKLVEQLDKKLGVKGIEPTDPAK